MLKSLICGCFLHYNRECPTDLCEAIASIIFAAPRCSDVPDLLIIRNLFTTKYGKEFISAVAELRPDSGVNREVNNVLGKFTLPEFYWNIELVTYSCEHNTSVD